MSARRTTSRDLPDRMLRVQWVAKRTGRLREAFYYNNQSGHLAGQPRTKIPLGTDRAAALVKWAALERADVPADQQTVGHAWKAYCESPRGLVLRSQGTQLDYRKAWKMMEPVFARAAWPAITVGALNVYLDKRTAKVRGNREIALLSILWNWAIARELTRAPNIVPNVQRNDEAPRGRYVTDAELEQLRAVASQVVIDALDLAFLTGQRPGDVHRMRWSHIREGYLYVQQGKTDARVAIAIEGQLAVKLQQLRTRPVVSRHLLTDERGFHPQLRTLQQQMTDARKAAGLDDLSLRDMRPKSASDEQSGATERLGHSSTAVTKRVYRRLATKARPTK